MRPDRTIRVGIDVGGTFTDVVAIDAATRELLVTVKVPTTHHATEGVAAGIVAGVERLLQSSVVDSACITFIAHSTTQATNALLEGDVARVGVLGLLDGLGWLARYQMKFGAVPLGSGGIFLPTFAFAAAYEPRVVHQSIDALVKEGVESIAVSASFGVDRPDDESAAVAYARERGLEATGGHDVSTAYGLRARTRTAALNAAILPRMLRTARMTADAVERAAIPAPLMVMRSDGGVMDVREIERRPILTLLSGPAAGIAGALLYERLSDGVFIEVGGTSSDCSVIRMGRPQMRPARIGGHRTMLRTLDVRTLGIGGGSMLRVDGNCIVDVGPRSAHIAGCAYASFVSPDVLDGARVERMASPGQDRSAYATLIAGDGRRIALTTTCAANMLGLVPPGTFAQGDAVSARRAFELLALELGNDAETLARTALANAAGKIRETVARLVEDYELDPSRLIIVGGGGGAGALVPAAAGALGCAYRIASKAEVIAPIGVALALVRDVVERTVFAPTPEEIASIRREAADRVIAAGAAPDRIEVDVEIDTQRNRVTAAAYGATAMTDAASMPASTETERLTAAARSLNCDPSSIETFELTTALRGYRVVENLRVVDERGIVRLALRDATLIRMEVREIGTHVGEVVECTTSFGDVGRALPALYLLRGARIAVYEGLSSADQAVALALEETSGCAPDESITLLIVKRQA